MNQALIEFLANRRSVKPDLLGLPAPAAAELAAILKIAARVPDHKRLVPWRFVVFEGDARARIGNTIADICANEEQPTPSAHRLEVERGRFLRAPVVIAVVARQTEESPVPVWEQTLSAGAAAFNLCLAANAHGYATSWITEWMAYNDRMRSVLGLKAGERIAGFVHIGTAREAPSERERPDMSEIVSYWSGE